jgi:tetratricopeptide (TPR) repeat protein
MQESFPHNIPKSQNSSLNFIMNETLDILYKLITHEQTNGYKDNSALEGFEKTVSDRCDNEIARFKNEQIHKLFQDIKTSVHDYGIANYSVRQGKITEIGRMLLTLRDLIQNYRPDETMAQRYVSRSEIKERALQHKQEGRYGDAISDLENVLESNPDDTFALSQLAHIYLLQNNLEESNRLADMALKLDPSNVFANRIKGDILFMEGYFEESALIFEGIINLKPDDAYTYSKLGTIYRKQNRINDALSAIKRGLEIDPENPALHKALGDVYSQSGNDEIAISEYQKAIDIDPEDEYALKGIVLSKSKGKDINTAISQLQKVLKIPSHSQNPHLHALLGSYFKQNEQYESAISELRESLKLEPDSIYFQTQLAFCYSKSGQYQRVVELLEPINRMKPKDQLITQALAKAYTNLGRIEDARKLLIDILYIYPKDRFLRAALMKIGKMKAGEENDRDDKRNKPD